MSRPPSLLARSLEPLVHALWPLLLIWTALTAGLWWFGDAWISTIANAGLRDAVSALARQADTLWLTLAALNLYLALAASEGMARARGIAFAILAVAGAVATASAWTGCPLGHVAYTARLGARLGPVPLGWLLLWLVVVCGGRALAGRALPRASHATVALVTGVLALLTDLNLEPIATRLRLYWFWHGAASPLPVAPTCENYATWFAAAAALAWSIRGEVAPRSSSQPSALILVLFNSLLALGHLRLAISA